MAHFEIRENDTEYAKYDLHKNSKVILQAYLYDSVYEYLYELMSEEDTLQEVHDSSSLNFCVMDYSKFLEMRAKKKKFDDGL